MQTDSGYTAIDLDGDMVIRAVGVHRTRRECEAAIVKLERELPRKYGTYERWDAEEASRLRVVPVEIRTKKRKS